MDNAFERARAAYGSGAYDDATLEFLFPQLKESEDERIRTRLSEYFRGFLEGNEHCYKDGGYVKWEGLDVKSILDWLEKQKEQKPAEPSDEELQRHQDELYDFKVFAAKQAREHHISFVHDFEWNNFCAGLLSYFNEKQKPAEWSKEDEDMLNSCISSIEEAKENRYAYKETDGDTSYDHEIAWLKSLRPSWKPSEEQMKQLHYALTPGSAFDCDILNELYKQLKNLM